MVRTSLIGPQPFFHAASTSNGPVGGRREEEEGGGGEGRAVLPLPSTLADPRCPTDQTSWTPAHGLVCAAFHLTGVPQSGQVRQATSSYLEDTLEEIGPRPRRWVPGNNDAQLNSASRHALRAPANAGPALGVNLVRSSLLFHRNLPNVNTKRTDRCFSR